MRHELSTRRRQMLSLLLFSFAWMGTSVGHAADDWPQKAVRIIVPYPPGGPTDLAARQFAERLVKLLGQAVVVENRGGAGGTMGMEAVAKAAPDGSTFAFTAVSPLTSGPHMMRVGYDPIKDFAPVASVMYAPVYVLATPAFKGASFADAVAQARVPGKAVSIASPGYGSVGHLMIEQLRRQSGANFVHVPYKGGTQITTDAAGGQFDLLMANPSDAIHGLIERGTLRVLAVAAPERLAALPDTPTLLELGYKDANLTSSFGFFAPASTSPTVVERMNVEINRILQQADMRERLRKLDSIPTGGTPARFASAIRAEHEANGKIIRAANIRTE